MRAAVKLALAMARDGVAMAHSCGEVKVLEEP
jgi:hypothetical protein